MKNDIHILHEVRRLYLASQKRFADVKTRNEPSEYWRGRMDAFYVVLALLQENTEEQ
jgi:hypothetical protein